MRTDAPLKLPGRMLDPQWEGWMSGPREVYCPHCRDMHECLTTVIHGRVLAECAVWGASFEPEAVGE